MLRVGGWRIDIGADGSVTDDVGSVVNDQTAVAACALGRGPELESALDHIEALRGVYVASTTEHPAHTRRARLALDGRGLRLGRADLLGSARPARAQAVVVIARRRHRAPSRSRMPRRRMELREPRARSGRSSLPSHRRRPSASSQPVGSTRAWSSALERCCLPSWPRNPRACSRPPPRPSRSLPQEIPPPTSLAPRSWAPSTTSQLGPLSTSTRSRGRRSHSTSTIFGRYSPS